MADDLKRLRRIERQARQEMKIQGHKMNPKCGCETPLCKALWKPSDVEKAKKQSRTGARRLIGETRKVR